MRTTIELKGLEETVRGFKNLGVQAQTRIIRNTARAGATTVRNALKAAAPRDDGTKSQAVKRYGTLRTNIRSAQLRSGGKFLPYYKVDTKDAFWGHFLDVGTGVYNVAPGPKAKGAAARTHITPTFWWRNTIERIRGQVTNAMVASMRRAFQREWAKVK